MSKNVKAQVKPDAIQEAQQAQPARRVPPAKHGIPELLVEAKEWFLALERSVAGYNSLQASLMSFQNQTPDGERKKGLPIFRFPASVDGRTSIEVVCDMKHVDPAYVPHVLIPLINVQAAAMTEALGEISERVDLITNAMNLVVHPEQGQA